MHTVIGPTPPGTGVITEAICFTTSKSTSPTILPGLSPYEIPTSITTASYNFPYHIFMSTCKVYSISVSSHSSTYTFQSLHERIYSSAFPD